MDNCHSDKSPQSIRIPTPPHIDEPWVEISKVGQDGLNQDIP